MAEEQKTSRNEPAFLSALETLVRWRRLIIFNVAAVLVVAVIISLVLPKWYRATAVLLPPEASPDPLSTLGALQITAATANLPWFATPSDIYGAILTSRGVSKSIVDEFDLMRIYKTRSLDKALRKLERHRWVRVTDEGLIYVAVEAKDPVRAAEMANAFTDALDAFNRDTRMTEGKKTRIFVEDRLRDTGQELQDAETALQQFQEEYGAIELTEQTVALIQAAAEIESQIRETEIGLATLSGYSTDSHPRVKLLKARKQNLEKQLSGLLGESELGKALLGSSEAKPFPKLSEVPSLGVEYARLLRNVELQSKIAAFLTQEYERAKITESRDTPTVQILDQATPPEKRSRPKRRSIVAISGVVALLGSGILAFCLDWARQWSEDPGTARRITSLRDAFREDWRDLRSSGRPGGMQGRSRGERPEDRSSEARGSREDGDRA